MSGVERRHEPASCACGQCGKSLIRIGEDVSEQLDVEPARFLVHHHIRLRYACCACETVVAEFIPVVSLMAAPSLLARGRVQKFQDHFPLYHIKKISSRYGVPLACSTLADIG